MADLYEKNMSLIHFKFTREDGTIDYTRGYQNGTVRWNKLYVQSKQANIYNSAIYVNHNAVRKNGYQIDLEVYVAQGNNSFTTQVKYSLPAIQSIEIVQDSIVPYTWYAYKVRLNTTERSYDFYDSEKIGILDYEDFQWHIDSRLERKEKMFRYAPRNDSTIKHLRLHVKNEKLGLQDVKDVPLQAVRYKNFVFTALHGKAGANGENGESGGTGEHGGNGGGGWHGADGDEGKHIEIVLAKYSDQRLKLAVFIDDKREVYYIPMNTKIDITAPGGKGGDGGRGGDGGSGGSSSDEYEAGDDGEGGPGGNGGNGGLGGYVHIFSDLELGQLSQMLMIKTPGGQPGYGGRGGSGSPSGTGGKLGKRGKTGTVAYQIISTEDIAKMMQELDL